MQNIVEKLVGMTENQDLEMALYPMFMKGQNTAQVLKEHFMEYICSDLSICSRKDL